MSTSEICNRLATELRLVQACAPPNFSGLGVVVWDEVTHLPVCPLTDLQPTPPDDVLAVRLAAMGSLDHPFHDGFHIINKSFDLVWSGMYFSPPIVPGVQWDRGRGYGGRYVAALLGSLLPGALATGVISNRYGVFTFENGFVTP